MPLQNFVIRMELKTKNTYKTHGNKVVVHCVMGMELKTHNTYKMLEKEGRARAEGRARRRPPQPSPPPNHPLSINNAAVVVVS